MWWTNKGTESLNPPLTHKDGVCVQRYLGGNISLLAFEPSDIIGEWKIDAQVFIHHKTLFLLKQFILHP
jgi:hypothetical protein